MSVLQQTQIKVTNNIGRGSSFGTFGELLQGVIEKNDVSSDFLVTFPISRFSHATFIANSNNHDLIVYPSHKEKAKRFAAYILQYYNLPLGGNLMIESDIPVGKGLASSSADLVAVARSIGACYELQIPVSLIESFMKQIEPSDGVMYQGTVSYFHREGRLYEFLGQLPPMTVISIDEGGDVDTIEFNKISKPFTVQDQLEYRELLTKISKSIREKDVKGIGDVTTRSAILNQKLKPKKFLEEVIHIQKEIDAAGVAVTHSGTCLGILLSISDPKYFNKLLVAVDRLKKLTNHVEIYHSWNDYRKE